MAAAMSKRRVEEAADRAEALSRKSGSGAFGPEGETSDRADRRAGRGRLSSMDLVPEEAQEDILWAVGELNKHDRSQSDILFELNDRLAAKGVDEISKSAFNRKSVKLAAMTNRLSEARYLFQGLAPQFTAEKVDENTIALGEFIKLLILELTQEEGGRIGTKGAMELAKAHLAVIQGQAISAKRRVTLQREFAEKAEKAVDAVAAEKGLSTDTVRGIKEKILGLKLPTTAEPA